MHRPRITPSETLLSFLRRWLRRCPDCGCKGTPDRELWTVADDRDYEMEDVMRELGRR